MAKKPSKEEQKIIAAIEKLPFTPEEKTSWLESIQNYGLNEVTVKEILARIPTLQKGEDEFSVTRSGAQLTRLIQSWRLSTNLSGNRHRH